MSKLVKEVVGEKNVVGIKMSGSSKLFGTWEYEVTKADAAVVEKILNADISIVKSRLKCVESGFCRKGDKANMREMSIIRAVLGGGSKGTVGSFL